MSHFCQFRHKVQCHIAKYNLLPAIPNCPQTNHFIVHSPSYQLSKHLAQILAQLVSNTDSHVTNSSEFVSFIQTQKLAQKDILMSFDVVSLFTCVPVELAVLVDVAHRHGEITCSLLYPMCRMPGHLHGRRSCARRWMSTRGQ